MFLFIYKTFSYIFVSYIWHCCYYAAHNFDDFSLFKKGANKDCHGKNADHLIIKVPVGTIIRNADGGIVGDLGKEGLMFVAARGGAGGKGNHFFISDTEQAPKICEYGATGENFKYTLELKSMAHVGLVSTCKQWFI